MHIHILQQISVLWSMFHALVLFLILFRSRYSARKTFLLSACFVVPLVILNIVILALRGGDVDGAGKLFMLTCSLPSMAGFYLLAADRNAGFLFTFCLTNTWAYWIVSVSSLFDYFFHGHGYIMAFTDFLIFPFLEWLACSRVRRPFQKLQEETKKGWGVFAVMSVVYYMLMFVNGFFPVPVVERRQDIPAYLLVLILMPCTYATIFVSLYRQHLLFSSRQNDRILRDQKKQLEARLENQFRIQKLQHDMRGNVLVLAGLLAAGEVEKAQEYLSIVGVKIDSECGRYCGNPYLDAVFDYYDRRFSEQGIPLELDIQVGGEALPDEELLCQILANGLSNAYDALCGLLPREREASVQMRYKKEYLLIRIRNRCDAGLHVESGTLPTSTKDGPDHGIGLRTVQEYARQMGGEMVCYTEDGFFLMDVMIKKNGGPASGGARKKGRNDG